MPVFVAVRSAWGSSPVEPWLPRQPPWLLRLGQPGSADRRPTGGAMGMRDGGAMGMRASGPKALHFLWKERETGREGMIAVGERKWKQGA